MHTLHSLSRIENKTAELSLLIYWKLQSSVYYYIVFTPTYKYVCLYINVTLHVYAHELLHTLHKIIYHIKTTQDSQKLETLTENRREQS